MYDKYNTVSGITAGTSKLPPHKGILVVPQGSATPTLNTWLRDTSLGATVTVGFTFASATAAGPQILPIEVYAITSINGACAYRLN
jgi:hypothetical protein